MSTALRILFVDDHDDDVRSMVELLRCAGYIPISERVENADAFHSALHRGGWDLVISDYSISRLSGFEALSILLQISPEVPFIIVSGVGGDEVAVESIQAGASDFLFKSNLTRFVTAVSRAVRDAAERRAVRRAEAVLREQRSLLALIYDNTSDSLSLYTWDQTFGGWRLTSINRAALEFARQVDPSLGESELLGEALEHQLANLFCEDPGPVQDIVDIFYRASESGRMMVHDIDVQFAGEKRYFENTYVPFFGPDGITRHVLTVSRDVSARRKSEHDRRTFEARLAQSKKMEALGKLAGGVAHDFNNILTGIIGFTELIGRQLDVPLLQGFNAEILQAATRAKDLVRQILMFSRRQQADRRPVRLGDIVHEAARLIEQSAPTFVTIDRRSIECDNYLLGDPTQLHQVVMNLGTNAVHAVGNRPGRVVFRVEEVSVSESFARENPPLPSGQCIRLEVTDTGAGMASEVLERLFEPFFTTKGPGAGTGLGLSVVHGIVQNHEGCIRVSSTPGSGTTFSIFFPAVGSPAGSAQEDQMDDSTQSSAGNILFVDDETSIGKLVQFMLRSGGHTVRVFGNPVEACDYFAAHPDEFDLVITDLTMPGRTGIELARHVHAVRSELPIVLSSGYSDEVPEETLREVGIVEVLQKPFQLQSLLETVGRALANSSPRTSPVSAIR